MQKTFSIGSKKIGGGAPCFVVAEAGVNHNGDLAKARQLIDIAKESGADAVKFQAFRAETLVTKTASKAKYQKETTDQNESQFEMLKKLELNFGAHVELKTYCDQIGILFLSTPFDEACADFLAKVGVEAYKIPSGEITNPFLLMHIAAKKKPIILSTGMSNLEEVAAAVQMIEEGGNKDLALLHCVSQYPAEAKDANLRAIHTLKENFGIPVGFSDHTLGSQVALTAVALGADILEKHFTSDRNLPGPDHRASLEAQELKKMIEEIRNVETSLGDGRKIPAVSETDTALVARKSLVASKNIAKGKILTRDDLVVKRPGTGLSPYLYFRVVGLRANQDINEGTLLKMEMFS